jgi:hypothetical protein
VYGDVMGDNAARLLGLLPDEPRSRPAHAGRERVITGIPPGAPVEINGAMAVDLVATTWPETRSIFDRYGIPWRDSPLAFWEPIAQAAAAHGHGFAEQERLLAELNEAVSGADGTQPVGSR